MSDGKHFIPRLPFYVPACHLHWLSVLHQPMSAQSTGIYRKKMTRDQVITEIKKDIDFYEESGGGVTLSGGEVLIWHEFAASLLTKLQEDNIHTALETTGYATESVFLKVAAHADLLLFDMKHHDARMHKQYTGVSNELILKNMKSAAAKGIPIIARIPVIPGVNDTLDDARRFCNLLKEVGVSQVDLLSFHQFGQRKYEMLQMDYAMKDTKALHPKDLVDYKETFASFGFDVKI